MTRRWISDASPLIALAKAGAAHLLADLPDELLIPNEVAAEIAAGPPEDPARRLLEAGFGVRRSPSSVPSRLAERGLGRGETAVLALALEIESTVVLDDAAARRCAAALRLPLIGTVGVILQAKRAGAIASAAEVFSALRRAGARMDDEMVRVALASVGERPADF